MDAIVQLRPQFSHLDALYESKKVPRERGPDNRDHVEPEPEARAVNMAIKSSEGSEEDMYGGMRVTAKLLREMRDEPWQRLTWVDQDVRYVNQKLRWISLKSYRNQSHTRFTTMP